MLRSVRLFLSGSTKYLFLDRECVRSRPTCRGFLPVEIGQEAKEAGECFPIAKPKKSKPTRTKPIASKKKKKSVNI